MLDQEGKVGKVSHYPVTPKWERRPRSWNISKFKDLNDSFCFQELRQSRQSKFCLTLSRHSKMFLLLLLFVCFFFVFVLFCLFVCCFFCFFWKALFHEKNEIPKWQLSTNTCGFKSCEKCSLHHEPFQVMFNRQYRSLW